jgi:hypothetical protein
MATIHHHSTPNHCHEQLLMGWKWGAMGGRWLSGPAIYDPAPAPALCCRAACGQDDDDCENDKDKDYPDNQVQGRDKRTMTGRTG